MTPEKAIKFLEDIYDDRKSDYNLADDLPGQKAIKLGIEALKRCEWNYLNPQRADFRQLPSESEV